MKVISVPVSLEAMKRLDYDLSIDGDLIAINLTNELYDEIWKLGFFNEVNSVINKNIDDYEDESIDKKEELELLLEIVLKYLDKDIFFRELYELIKFAIKYSTGVFFFF